MKFARGQAALPLGSSVVRTCVASGPFRGHGPYNLGQRIRRLTPCTALSPTSHSASPPTGDCRFISDYDWAAAAAADAVNEFQITLWPNATFVAARGRPGRFPDATPHKIQMPAHLFDVAYRAYVIGTRSALCFSHCRSVIGNRWKHQQAADFRHSFSNDSDVTAMIRNQGGRGSGSWNCHAAGVAHRHTCLRLVDQWQSVADKSRLLPAFQTLRADMHF